MGWLFLKVKKRFFINIGILVLVLIGIGTIGEYQVMHSTKILSGVYIGGLDVSRMEQDQAEQEIVSLHQESMERKIVIKGEGKSWSFTPSQLGVKEDGEQTVKEAWKIGREGYFYERWYRRWQMKQQPYHIPLSFNVDENILTDHVKEMAQMIDQEAKDAGVIVKSNHQVEITPEENGLQVEIDDSVRALREVLETEDQIECNLSTKITNPQITAETAKSWQINGVVASFETRFDPGKIERSSNIKVAVKALENVLVMPQDVFSFNEVVGARTKEVGYKEALVIENNEFTPGLGGGICQVSSTMYNAILLANLSIAERRPHSLPISYVGPGRDATVAYGSVDFKFKNDREKPILLHAEYERGKMRVLILGTQGEFPKVNITSKVVEYLNAEEKIIKDPTLAPGQTIVVVKGHQGMIAEAYREVTADGKIISRERISRDIYKPQKAVIRVPVEPVATVAPIEPVAPTEPVESGEIVLP